MKCYFIDFLKGENCSSTKKLEVNGKEYENLWEYYNINYPSLQIRKDDSVALVSFPGSSGGANVVAAKILFPRIMNDSVPRKLKNENKLNPYTRNSERSKFIDSLQNKPFKGSYVRLNKGEWEIEDNRKFQITPPQLHFAEKHILLSPDNDFHSYKSYYRNKKRFIDEYGIYYTPQNVSRTLNFAFPSSINEEIQDAFCDSIVTKLNTLTSFDFDYEITLYDGSYFEAVSELLSYQPGIVVFTMSEEPAIYYHVEHDLKEWKIKRLTEQVLINKFRSPQWKNFIDLCAYDVAVQLGSIPYFIHMPGNYDGMLVLDVGDKRRTYGVSLFINSISDSIPIPYFSTITKLKPDYKNENINPSQLRKIVSELCNEFNSRFQSKWNPLKSLLIVRDGKFGIDETQTIYDLKSTLIDLGLITSSADYNLIELHKTSLKGIRISNKSRNVLEGEGFLLNEKTAILASSGASTLPSQGSVSPLMIEAKSDNMDLEKVSEYVFLTAQYNFGNPIVAQRLPWPVKLLDDRLQEKAAQLIQMR